MTVITGLLARMPRWDRVWPWPAETEAWHAEPVLERSGAAAEADRAVSGGWYSVGAEKTACGDPESLVAQTALPEGECCGRCRFMAAVERPLFGGSQSHWCQRYPPIFLGSVGTEWCVGIPPVRPGAWCGEYQARERRR